MYGSFESQLWFKQIREIKLVISFCFIPGLFNNSMQENMTLNVVLQREQNLFAGNKIENFQSNNELNNIDILKLPSSGFNV